MDARAGRRLHADRDRAASEEPARDPQPSPQGGVCFQISGVAGRRPGPLRPLEGAAPPLVDLALAAGPEGLAQLELLELAGGRAGQGLAELDRRRALVLRHAAPAVGD